MYVCVCTCISHMCLCVCPLPSSSLPERKLPENRNCTYKLFCVQIYWRIACKVLNSLLLEISKHLFTQQTDNLTSVLVKSPKFPGSLGVLMFNFIRRLSGGACLHASGLGQGVIWVQTAWLLALLGGSAAMISSSLWGLSVYKLTPLVPGIPQGLESNAMCCPGQVSHVFELSLVCHNHPCHCPQKGASESLFPIK